MRIGKVVILPVLLAVGLLVGGLGALAQTPPGDQAPTQTLLARVATILGTQEQALKDAFVKAQGEMQMEALTERLKNLVEKGTITQQQADQYLQWWQARPDSLPGHPWGLGGRFGGPPGWFKGHRLGGMMPGKGGPGPTN